MMYNEYCIYCIPVVYNSFCTHSVAPVSVVSLQRTTGHSPNFTLNCTSTGSPATTVIWRKDEMVLSNGGQYEMTQTLQDGVTATYKNILAVSGTPSALLGVYSCSILNEIGTATRNITINGKFKEIFYHHFLTFHHVFSNYLSPPSFYSYITLSLTPYSSYISLLYPFYTISYLTLNMLPLGLRVTMPIVLIVGTVATLTCSSDLDVTMTEWLYHGGVVQSSTGPQTQLLFNPVNDTIHNRQYTCRVTSPYGAQQQTITVTTEGRFK